MIIDFLDHDTADLWTAGLCRRLPQGIQRTAMRKLAMLNAAVKLDDLRVPPGNRLEALKGNRQGQHSIRINDQYRVCFVFMDGNAHKVEITDYH